MIEINLIPDVKQELLRAQSTRTKVISISIITSVVAIGLVVLLLFYVFAVQTIRNVVADQSITDQSAQLAEVEDLSEILTIQNQLGKIDELNESKKVDSRVFDMLAAVIPPAPNAVQVTSMTINADEDTIAIEGQTRAYDSMEVFKKTLESAVVVYTEEGEQQQVPLATEISTGETSYGEDATGSKVLRFTLTFKYAEELFSPRSDTIAVKLSVNGNVTDSYLGIPKSIFADPAKDIEE